MCLLVTERQPSIDTAHGIREWPAARDNDNSRCPAHLGDGRSDAVEMVDMFEQAATDFDHDICSRRFA